MEVKHRQQMVDAALLLQRLGARTVIITGGHLETPVDLLLAPGGTATFLQGTKIVSPSTHGTGCAFSTALACGLAKGKSMIEAARAAKRYVEAELQKPKMMGAGVGPVV
jgi:hydroxymethylpyrimidine/phosphomethylpyrimidine kinase